MGRLIDFVAVIDTPLEIALTRRLLRYFSPSSLGDIEQATREQLAASLNQMDSNLQGFLNGYLSVARDIYMAVHERAKANCDLVLDGSRSIEELAQELVRAVRRNPNESSGG